MMTEYKKRYRKYDKHKGQGYDKDHKVVEMGN